MPRLQSERSDLIPILGEVFREQGYEGASLALIGARTGLGKGSLYHFFPGGKAEMAEAVLADIDTWFEAEIYQPLRCLPPAQGLAHMLDQVERYFHSGSRVCLVGIVAQVAVRDRFADRVRSYFEAWITALADALWRQGHPQDAARGLAEDSVAQIQGALTLARALNHPSVFCASLARLRQRLLAPSPTGAAGLAPEAAGTSATDSREP